MYSLLAIDVINRVCSFRDFLKKEEALDFLKENQGNDGIFLIYLGFCSFEED